MSSRKDEKDRLRAEREAAEQAAAGKDSRRQRLFLAGGVVGLLAVVGGAIVAITSSGGSDSSTTASADVASVELPARKLTDLNAAAAAAGCIVRTQPSQGRGHTTDAVVYTTNPPTSGPHNPEPAQDGIYDPGNTPAPEQLVHSLEHGRVQFQYAPSLPKAGRDEIEATFDEQLGSFGPGYHAQVFENTTKMPYAVAATAWTHVLGCKRFTPQTIDALRAFRARYTDKGPEFIP